MWELKGGINYTKYGVKKTFYFREIEGGEEKMWREKKGRGTYSKA